MTLKSAHFSQKLTITLLVFLFIFSQPGILLAAEEAVNDNTVSVNTTESPAEPATDTSAQPAVTPETPTAQTVQIRLRLMRSKLTRKRQIKA